MSAAGVAVRTVLAVTPGAVFFYGCNEPPQPKHHEIASKPPYVCTPPASATDKPNPRGTDAAAMLAYDLSGSRFTAGHRYLDFRSPALVSEGCNESYECRATSVRVPMNHCEVLASRTTRLTLIWSPEVTGESTIELLLNANGQWRRFDWLRPGMGSDVARRISVDLPATAIRRDHGVNASIRFASRKGDPASHANFTIDGIELELLP